MNLECDVLIIGGGIAGLSLASELAPHRSIVLAEAEPTLAYHTSSRSARQLIPSYGPPEVQDLTRRTLEILTALQAETGLALTAPRAFLLVGSARDVAAKASGSMRPIPHSEALELCPQLQPDVFEAAGIDTTCVGADTDLLLEYHRRAAEDAGVIVLTRSRVTEARYDDDAWLVRAGRRDVRAGVVVNAAGAWADAVADLCGAAPQGLIPFRRTAAIVAAACVPDTRMPMVAAADDSFYFRAENRGLLISPCESVPAVAGDAQPNPGDIDTLIERLNSITTLGITSVTRSWTGLRTQTARGLPVVGFDPGVPGLFWLAGQGGYGFQTSSGLAELATGLLTGTGDATGPAAGLRPRTGEEISRDGAPEWS
ncbi:FAD-binding oxidoreductase [Arthrobacter sp. Br18]|uniref:NAD(P)/FAD-dependent oxidoreductase n=1 Tax=Arthrobacter sp. Br18 TaxID=1312954 RepID=UPI0004796A04|nr:FAD-binding oxidoreductase [Arthrobacter sp. Br18]